MPSFKDRKPLVLYVILFLIVINMVVLISAVALLNQAKFYSAAKFTFTYDENKLAITNVGGFQYDQSGNIDKFDITLQNKDPSNAYSGTLEVVVEGQSYQIAVSSIAGGATKKYTVDLNPNLPTSSAFSISATVFMSSGADLEAIKATAIADTAIDGTIGTEWNDAKHYTSIPIDPQGTAEIWVKNDGTNLYIALKFTADSSNPWLALQMGTTGCMDSGADVAIFGDDNVAANGYSDAYYDSSSSVKADTTQNGKGALTVGTGNVVTIELKKPLNSGDSAGKDIAWSAANTYFMVMAWDTNGGGSSGGSVSHKSGTTPTARSILIGS